MKINIRYAVQEDCTRIRPLQQEIADLHHEGRPDLFKTQARFFTEEDFAERLNNPKHTVLIAETTDGTVVGYAFGWIKICRNHSNPVLCDRKVLYIDDICVLKAYQRNGIGRKLFDCCKTIAQENKCKLVELGVWAFNTEAIAFYRSCGMKERIYRMECTLEEK